MWYRVLKVGHGIDPRKARWHRKSAKASYLSFYWSSLIIFWGARMLSNRDRMISLNISWCSTSVWITKAIGAKKYSPLFLGLVLPEVRVGLPKLFCGCSEEPANEFLLIFPAVILEFVKFWLDGTAVYGSRPATRSGKALAYGNFKFYMLADFSCIIPGLFDESC